MPKTKTLPDLFTEATDAWLAAIVDSSDDAVVGKTLDSVIRSWNRGATRVFGYEPKEIVGQSVLKLIPPERRSEETEIVSRLVRGERVDHFETVRLRKDGTEIDVSLSVSPIRNKDGEIIGAAKIARDITEARRMQRAEREMNEQLQELASELEQQLDESQGLQQELEEANEQLVRTAGEAAEARRRAEDANAAKSAFLATMSHELRTPLNAIIGYVDLLTMELRGPISPAQRDDLARTRRSADTLLRLIDDVLTFAKLEGGRLEYRMERIHVNELLASLETFIAPRIALKGLEYRYTPCASDLTVSVDRAKIEQILLNLLANAVKFTNDGHIDVACRTEDHQVLIDVHDTGGGIRSELLETIFEPFVQGDRSLTRTAEGTGLGLSISRQLARAMGGEIRVSSVVGTGSTFTLVLPAKD